MTVHIVVAASAAGAIRDKRKGMVVMTAEHHPRRDKLTMDEFPIVVQLPVLWGDQDLFGHVNNTVYFKWYESSRIAYWYQSGMEAAMRPKQWGPILASVSCDYLKQINFPDTVTVAARISEIRRSSMILDHAIYSESNQAISARGRSVIVLFDYGLQKSQRITEEIRAVIHQLEGRER